MIDCARANAPQGLAVTTQLCGYDGDTAAFESALQVAAQEMGLAIASLPELIQHKGLDVAPDSLSSL